MDFRKREKVVGNLIEKFCEVKRGYYKLDTMQRFLFVQAVFRMLVFFKKNQISFDEIEEAELLEILSDARKNRNIDGNNDNQFFTV